MEQVPVPPADASGPSLRRRRLAEIFRRAPDAEGRFWYSVVTTGVYCRPTCPSRRAREHHIRLHDTLAEARATGFRPCGRCNPEAASQNDLHRALVQTVCRRIEADPGIPSSRILAEAVALSPSHLHRIFRRITGTTPSAYARRIKAMAAALAPVAAEPRTIAGSAEDPTDEGRRGAGGDGRRAGAHRNRS